MTERDRWDELEELFKAAVELPPQERASLLDARSLDAELRRELDELLRAHDALEVSGADVFLTSLDTARASTLLDVPTGDASRHAALASGETVGRYQIVRPLGRGGMGVLYLATDPRLNRPVALKLLPPHLSVDSSARRRFEEEARAASLLDHPNIATVYEVDETADGRLFIAMAYYEGETLREKLARGALSSEDVVSLAVQIASGLAAAHAAGLVHRDIKPGNVIVTPQGVAKIVDFGIARIATDEITHDDGTAGTIAYMSPEQTHGAPPHPRADVWSFGVMLYEMLTGVRPFRGDRDAIVLFAIRNDEPEPIEQLRAGTVPARLIRIVGRCLRKDPLERYPGASGILAELEALPDSAAAADSLDSTSAVGARAGSAVKRRRWRVRAYVAALVAVLAVLGAGAVRVWNSQRAGRPTAMVPSSIAVLPFDNQLRAADDDHLSAGIAGELITALGAVPGLRVAARTSTFALASSGLDANAIAGRLGVATILQGSVRGDTARLRISARLVRARDSVVLWSEVYDVPMRDVFTVQERIARSVTDVLDLRLASDAHDSLLVGRPTVDLEAYDLYLRGRHVRTRDTRDRLEQALAYFREAIARDPGFANAYSGLAETYVNLANFGYVAPMEGFGNANIAAERALKLNPRLAEAYVSHAYVLTSLGAFDRAEAAFRRAIDLNPSSPLGRHYYSLLLAMLGRTDEALVQNRRARELDPLFTPAATDYGILLCQRGELSSADTALRRALAIEPKFALTLYWLGTVRAAEGSYSEATQFLERAARTSPNYPGVPGSLAYVYTRTGNTRAADSLVASLRARATDDRGRTNLAFAYAALGRPGEAFDLLQKVEWDVPSMIGLRADPLLRSLRSDPRYAALVRRAGVTTPRVTAVSAGDSFPHRAAVLREEVPVHVGDTLETWRLEWRSPPKEACGPESPDASTGPCAGFAYGEMGRLDLVRQRPGRRDERLDLTTFFHDAENPSTWSAADTGLAVLQRWPQLDADAGETDLVALGRRVRARRPVRVMNLRDYDHDGRATEFMLQVSTAPTSRRVAVVVGVSKAQPSLHAFTSVAHPERPLVLHAHAWDALLRSRGKVSAVEWACGDHGSGTRTEVHISITAVGIDGTRSVYECGPHGAAGRLVSSERL